MAFGYCDAGGAVDTEGVALSLEDDEELDDDGDVDVAERLREDCELGRRSK